MTDEAAPQRRAPYQGLIPYSEDDAPFFFGREKETRLIIANLFAAPLTLLYGASGVGKSSVLRAGVAYQLRQRDELAQREELPQRDKLLVVVFNTWQGDPVRGLKASVAEAAAHGTTAGEVADDATALADFLSATAARLPGRLMIILDQFEEYFLYHPQENAFDAEFPRALAESAPINFLISIREDALAKLDRFEGRIPTLFDNYLRLDHLDRTAARAAIEQPIAQYNRTLAAAGEQVSIEAPLVEAVLEQVKTGQVVLGERGRGVVGGQSESADEARIETPYLQLVMMRLWDEEQRANSRTLRLATLQRLGGAERIVRTHLDAVMRRLPWSQRRVATRVFHYLVTPSGSKIAHTARDLASYSGVGLKHVTPLLQRLAAPDLRLLRSVEGAPSTQEENRYEIFHDVLAPAIIDWRYRHRPKYKGMLLAALVGTICGLLFASVVPALFRPAAGPPSISDTFSLPAAPPNKLMSKQVRLPDPYGLAILYLEYDPTQAWAGNKLQLNVTLVTESKLSNYLIYVEPKDHNVARIITLQTLATPGFTKEGFLSRQKYQYMLSINQSAQPRIYDLDIIISDSFSNDVPIASFPLAVGVRAKGRLTIINSPISMTVGDSTYVYLRVRNDFPDYAVEIRKLNVSAVPAGIVEGFPNESVLLDHQSLAPGEVGTFRVRLKAAPMTLNQLVFGLSQTSKLIMTITYDDNYGRSITDTGQADLRVRPNLSLLLLSSLAGGLVGSAAQLGWRLLQTKLRR
ncbi:MAG: hypothetical protein ACJ74W_03480 [Pyrinomonadaceae bacterium]